MAQTEEMKRLLLKGKIVGYQLHTFTNSEGIYHSRTSEIINNTEEDGGGSDLLLGNNILFAEGNTTEGLGFNNWIYHDSFEPGIKDDKEGWNEWRFEGDIFEFKSLADAKYIGILQYSGYQWHMGTKNQHGVGISFPLYDLICDGCKTRHIGNIHEDNFTIGETKSNRWVD